MSTNSPPSPSSSTSSISSTHDHNVIFHLPERDADVNANENIIATTTPKDVDVDVDVDVDDDMPPHPDPPIRAHTATIPVITSDELVKPTLSHIKSAPVPSQHTQSQSSHRIPIDLTFSRQRSTRNVTSPTPTMPTSIPVSASASAVPAPNHHVALHDTPSRTGTPQTPDLDFASPISTRFQRTRTLDGQASVEMHLELYVEDLVMTSTNQEQEHEQEQEVKQEDGETQGQDKGQEKGQDGDTKVTQDTSQVRQTSLTHPLEMDDDDEDASPPLHVHDTLLGLEFLLHARIQGKLHRINYDLCYRLAIALMYHIRRSQYGWSIRPKPSETAELALRVFAQYCYQLVDFQCAVGDMDVSLLRDSLKLHRHLRSTNEQHRSLTLQLLIFLVETPNVAKIERWQDIVKRDYHKQVESMLLEQGRDLPKPIIKRHPPANIGLPPRGTYYDTNPQRLIEMFKTSEEHGLNDEDVQQRQEQYGLNVLPTSKKISILHLLFKQIKDFIVLVLIAASIVSFAIEDIKAGVVLLVVIVINTLLGFTQEYRAARAIESLASLSAPQATVIRNGVEVTIDSSQLVPGDIVILEEGMAVPADMRLIQVSQLQVVEAILTGESVPVTKTTTALKGRRHVPIADRINTVYQSTTVAKGRGRGVVVNTGITTQVGQILASVSSGGGGQTPLQKKLDTLGKWLVLVAVVACSLVVIIGLARGLGTDIIKTGISLAVSVVPEGLVTVVVLTMALGMQRMTKHHALVRSLPAVETLGGVTTICSDKTGTLTQGKMCAREMWIPSPSTSTSSIKFYVPEAPSVTNQVDVQVVKPTSKQGFVEDIYPRFQGHVVTVEEMPCAFQWVLLITALCNNATLTVTDDGIITTGDATEVALLQAAHYSKADVNYWNTKLALKRILEFAFTSDRKRMSVLFALPATSTSTFLGVSIPVGTTHILLSKGASEAVLERCTHYITQTSTSTGDATMTVVPCDQQLEQLVNQQGGRIASAGQRVLAVSFRFVTSEQHHSISTAMLRASEDVLHTSDLQDDIADDTEQSMIFAGLLGLMDPPRSTVSTAVHKCHTAGIRVCMITGDHQATAIAIAKQIGIINMTTHESPDKRQAINGDALSVLTEQQLAALNPFPVVFSRVSPENKLKIVKALQRRGDVVAMTGDGVNDAPAIKQADVGIAMGQGGTEVTRQAADIILTDDNFASIVVAVEEGRRIFDNIIKFIVYLLSCNGAEVIVMLTAVAAGWPVPFGAMMILWANIFADVPPSLSMGVEPVEPDAMERLPRPPGASVVNRWSFALILFNACEMALLTLIIYWYMYYQQRLSLIESQSIAFLTLATIQLFHAFISRSRTRSIAHLDTFIANPWMVFGVVIAEIFILMGCFVPGLNDWLGLASFPLRYLLVTIATLGAHIGLMEVEKFILRLVASHRARHRTVTIH